MLHLINKTFHRQIFSKSSFKKELEEIEGIGEKKATDLLKAFQVKNIKTLTERELTKVIGASKAREVWLHYNKPTLADAQEQ